MTNGIKQKIIWVIAGAATILLLAGIFLAGKTYKETNRLLLETVPAKIQMPAKISQNTGTEKTVPQNLYPENSTAEENNRISRNEAETSDWKTFVNENQGYKISYPPSAQVAQAGTYGHELDYNPNYGFCVSVHLDYGTIIILGKKHDEEDKMFCMRTGVGAEWSSIPSIEVEAFGKKYTAAGMGSSSAGYRNEFYMFSADSGESVEFGIEVNEKHNPEIPYDDAKAEVLSVLKTLEEI